MKVIKPQKIGLLHKAYSFKHQHYFVSAPVVFFDMNALSSNANPVEQDPHNPYSVLEENLQWPLVQSQLGGQILDMVMPKQHAEVMLAGSAWNPEGETAKSATVGLRFAEIEKRLTIRGQREWQKAFMGYKLTQPQPWISAFIGEKTGYGGEGYEDNPFGLGYYLDKTKSPLLAPLVEDEDVSVKKMDKRYAPAGFGSIDINHSARKQFNGNYASKEWLEKHFPNLAPDTDFRLFQAARHDQQLKGYLVGDESYTLANLVENCPVFEGRLPAVKPRSFVHTSDKENNFKEVPLHLDTVWLFPDVNIGALIWHGQIEVTQLDALDIQTSLVAYEALHDEPRSEEHYYQAMLARVNPDTALEAMSDEAPLSPVATAAQTKAEQQELAEEIAEQEALAQEHQDQYLEEVKAANNGVLPPGFKPPKMTPPTVLASKASIKRGSFNGKAMMAEVAKQKAAAEKQQKEMQAQLAQAQQLSDKQLQNMDPTQVKAFKAKGNVSDKIGDLQDMSKSKSLDLDEDQMKMLEEQQFKAQQYSMTPISDWPEDEYAQEKREVFLAAFNRGESMKERNWSGADLSNLELNNIDLSGCNLENCNFENTQLQQSNLMSAALLGSKISATNFDKARLQEANLSSCVGINARFNGALLTKAMFMKCNLENSQFMHADMRMVVVFEARLLRCQFTQSLFTKLSIINSQCQDCDFSGIQAEMFVSMNSDYTLSRCDNMQLSRSAFLESKFTCCNFAQSTLDRVQFSGGSDLSGACLVHVKAEQCGFRRINGNYWFAPGASLIMCDLGDSDFRHGHFVGAKLVQSVLSEARFHTCDFSESNFHTALLRNTHIVDCKLNNVNFYQADAIAAVVTNCNFKAAENLDPLTKRRWQHAHKHAA